MKVKIHIYLNSWMIRHTTVIFIQGYSDIDGVGMCSYGLGIIGYRLTLCTTLRVDWDKPTIG